jgi:hypothetical protein
VTTTNARMFLWLGLVMALYINYDTYERKFAPKLPPPPTATELAQAAAPTAPGALPGSATTLAASVPQTAPPAPIAAAAPTPLGGSLPVAAAPAVVPVAAPVVAAVAPTPALDLDSVDNLLKEAERLLPRDPDPSATSPRTMP